MATNKKEETKVHTKTSEIKNEDYISIEYIDNNTKNELLANVKNNEEIKNINIDNFLKTIKINTIAPFLLTKELFEHDDNGIVINVASTDGIDTYNEYNLPYATSKAALIHITKQLDQYYQKQDA